MMKKLIVFLLRPIRWLVALLMIRVEKTIRNPLASWPRNALCLCGKPEKFKHCCMNRTPSVITKRELQQFLKDRPFLADLLRNPHKIEMV